MKILYLLQEFPYPLTSGTVVKVFNIISHMAAHHECELLCFGDRGLSETVSNFKRKIPGVKVLGLFEKNNGVRLQVKRIGAFLKGEPVFLQRWQTIEFKMALKKLLAENDYDIIHLDALAMAPYISQLNDKTVVISTTDAVSRCYDQQARATRSLPKKIYRWFESKVIARFERQILPKFSRVHVVSRVDKEYLHALNCDIKVEYIEHGVPDSVLSFEQMPDPEKRHPARILIPGGLINTAAVSSGIMKFLSSVHPILRKDHPNLIVTILGRYPSKKLLQKIAAAPAVQYVDWVDDYYAEHARADVVALTDLSGSGIKTRFLYALGLGCPVVASPAASAGFEIAEGIHFLRRELDATFAEAIATLLENPTTRQRLSFNARSLMAAQFSKTAGGIKWEALYRNLIINE